MYSEICQNLPLLGLTYLLRIDRLNVRRFLFQVHSSSQFIHLSVYSEFSLQNGSTLYLFYISFILVSSLFSMPVYSGFQHSSQLRLIPYLHHTSSVLRQLPLDLLSEIFNEGGIKIISLSNICPIIIYFHSSQCRLIPYLHQRPIFFKTNSSIVTILELIRGAQCLIEVIRSSGEEM